MKEIVLEAKRENLSQVFDFVKSELEGCGCSKKTQRQIKLSVEEIFMNIASYAYNPETGPATISIEVEQDPLPVRVILSFIDHGKPYDPLQNEAPDTSAELDDREVGGLGIFLVRTTMDGVDYEYKDGHNILTIKKELTPTVGAEEARA